MYIYTYRYPNWIIGLIGSFFLNSLDWCLFFLLLAAITINCVRWKRKFLHMNCKFRSNGRMHLTRDPFLAAALVWVSGIWWYLGAVRINSFILHFKHWPHLRTKRSAYCSILLHCKVLWPRHRAPIAMTAWNWLRNCCNKVPAFSRTWKASHHSPFHKSQRQTWTQKRCKSFRTWCWPRLKRFSYWKQLKIAWRISSSPNWHVNAKNCTQKRCAACKKIHFARFGTKNGCLW